MERSQTPVKTSDENFRQINQLKRKYDEDLKAAIKQARQDFESKCWSLQSEARKALEQECLPLVADPEHLQVFSSNDAITRPFVQASVYDPEEGPLDWFKQGWI